MNQDQLVKLITEKLKNQSENIRHDFLKNKVETGIGFCSIDGLLPVHVTQRIFSSFSPENSAWREMNTFRERKLTTKQYDQFDPILKAITFAIQAEEVVTLVEELTNIKNQEPDPHLYAGGLSMMRTGDFLDPHIDNSHDQFQKVYRRLNLLFYVSPNWALEDGGNLELWNPQVTQRITVESRFNRLVLMETHDLSWHSVSKIVKQNALRCCVSNYYFSKEAPKPERAPYYHVTSFLAPPEQVVKRAICRIDNSLRTLLRLVKKAGFADKDLYQGRALK